MLILFTPVCIANIMLARCMTMALMTRFCTDNNRIQSSLAVEYHPQRVTGTGTLLIQSPH